MSGRDGPDRPDAAQLMLLTAFVLVIAFVALAGMVARVTQLPAETRQSAERPIFTESRSIVASLEELVDQLVTVYGIDDAATNPDGDAVEALSFDFNDAVAHLDRIQSARGFSFEASPLVCTDRGDLDSDGFQDIRLWMDFELRNTQTRIIRSVSVELDGLAITKPCPDPGFPFEDANGDLLFNDTVDGDVQLTAADVTDGIHETQDGFGLVIPASVGPISVDTTTEVIPDLTGITFRGHGSTLIAVDVTNTHSSSANGEIHIHTSAGDLWLAEVALTVTGSNSDITLAAGDGLHLEWGTLDTPDDGGDSGTACIALHAADTSQTIYVEGLFVDDSNNEIEAATGDSQVRADDDFRTVGTWSHGFSNDSCGI